jgi:NAD(P)-dependent dehydrogenase (short-subunit alcohol dehydrogenase family)
MTTENLTINLKEKNILLTGGSQGFGLSLAEELIKRNANLVLCARSKEKIDSALIKLSPLKDKNQKIHAFVTDISNSSEIDDLYINTQSTLGNIDVLINNAGVIGPIEKFLEVDIEEWKEVFDINLFGSALMIKKFLPDMVKQKSGKVIQLSGGGEGPLFGMSGYASSKSSILRLIETLSKEYANSGVEFNSVAPGMLKTRLLKYMINAGPEKTGEVFHKKSLEKNNDLIDSTEKACKLILFLCSERSNGITGKLISAEWDSWYLWQDHIKELNESDVYTLRRIVGKDRNFVWGDI